MGRHVVFAAVITAALISVPAPAATARAAPDRCEGGSYAVQVHTRTDLAATVVGRTKARVTVTVSSALAGSGAVTGTVALSGAVQRTVRYDGDPVSVVVPTRRGRTYRVRAAFTPTDPAVHGCSRGAVTFTSSGTPDGGPGPGPGGTLPDTGGPSWWWLLLASLLLGGGGLAVRQSRTSGSTFSLISRRLSHEGSAGSPPHSG